MTTFRGTYHTTRGTFEVLERFPVSHAMLVRRADGRAALIAASDWETWEPTLLPEGDDSI